MEADRALLEESLAVVRGVIQRSDPALFSGEECQAMVESFGQMERAAASGIALFSPKVVETGVYAKSGHASAQDWLGAVSGTSSGVAKERLAAAGRAAQDQKLQEALHQGLLSAPQLSLVAGAAGSSPDAVADLLDLVEDEASHQELSERAKEMKAAARSRESEREQLERVHTNRHFRWHQDEHGGIRGEFLCDEVAWAKVAPILEGETRARWKAAGSDSGLSLEAARLDAFIDLVGGAKAGMRGGARPQVLVIVDAEALRRGTTTTGEICEIEGIGPVPVEAAVELLGEGNLQFIIKEGTDIKSVTKSSRDLAQKTHMALAARDRGCVVCGTRHGLQADHCFVDYAKDGPTTLDNLALLCPKHHDMKTYGGWTLIRQKDGSWLWQAPKNPPSAGAIARAKKLAVAQAKGRQQHNLPRRN